MCYFGGAPGKVVVNITGDGDVKDGVKEKVKELLQNMGGDIQLKVDGKRVKIHSYDNIEEEKTR